MAIKHIKLFFTLFFRPLSAFSFIIDEGRWLYGAAIAFAVSIVFAFTITDRLHSSYEAAPLSPEEIRRMTAFVDEEGNEKSIPVSQIPPEMLVRRKPLPIVGNTGWLLASFSRSSALSTPLTLAFFYVPALILAMSLIAPIGSFGVALRRDYGPLLACSLMGWAAAHLPIAIAGLLLDKMNMPASAPLWLWAGAKLLFAFYMIIALRILFGTTTKQNAGGVSLSWVSAGVETFILASQMLWLLASPCVFFLVYAALRGGLSDIDSAFRGRQSFRRSLETATINPRDSEAHYQLGLIYQQRRQYTEAINRFRKAVEIDETETDAHFQLGRIARQQRRLQDAIDHFNTVVSQDDNHSHGEIWREIGATYADASMFEDSRAALETYVDRRPFDPEGLYLSAHTLNRLDRRDEAREMLLRCIEAVHTMPFFRRGASRKWGKLAEKQLREFEAQKA
jgi:hypothetical protein